MGFAGTQGTPTTVPPLLLPAYTILPFSTPRLA
jgi:hypothetical protein